MNDPTGMNMVTQTASVSAKIQEALVAAIPVAPDQLMTVQIPATIIDTSEKGPYRWNKRNEASVPDRIKINEARLADSVVPLSKTVFGVSERSVARSYVKAVDMLVPEFTPVNANAANTLQSDAAKSYAAALEFLKSPTSGPTKSVIDKYNEKQQAWSQAVSVWNDEKAKVREAAKDHYPNDMKQQQKYYDAYIKETYRKFNDNVKAKYVDWVVNGNKNMVEEYTGIADCSSPTARVESSKEAARNLVVIDPNNLTEWHQVRLTPENWVACCRDRVAQWGVKNTPGDQVTVSKVEGAGPSRWTQVSFRIGETSSASSKDDFPTSTLPSSEGRWWLWSTSAGSKCSETFIENPNASSECWVDVKFEALLVMIDRTWLHAELFSDAELNTTPDVNLSPGAPNLHQLIDQKDFKKLAQYSQFASYPIAFIVASNIELEFRGDTAALVKAIEASNKDVAKVGWGPFTLSASNSEDKTSARTKMETTSTSTKISLEAPAIVGWVSQLVPQLPRPRGMNSLA